MTDTICAFIKEVNSMNELIIFSKTKTELINKVNSYLNDDEIEEYYKKCLLKWKEWFNDNEDKIVLSDLCGSDCFYRAYYNDGVLGIQRWKESDNETVIWERNIYTSKADILDDEETIVIQ